jgi:hypothetical protein
MPWARAQFRVQDQAFREGLARAATPAPLALTQAKATLESSVNHQPPVLPPDVTQFYLPVKRQGPAGAELEYQPWVLGFAEVVFVVDKRKGKEHSQTLRLLARPAAPGRPMAWQDAEAIGEHLADSAPRNALWANVPDTLDTGRKLKSLERAFADYLYSTQKLALLENRALGLVSEPGETGDHFRDRCRAAAVQQAEQALALEKVKFTPKFEALDADLPDAAPEQEKSGGSWLGWIFTTAPAKPAPGPASSRQEEKVRKLTADYLAKKAEIAEKWKRIGDEATPIQVKPRKADVHVTHFGLGWVPCWRVSDARGQAELVPAYR